MKNRHWTFWLLGVVLAATGLVALAPGLMSPVARYLGIDTDGLGSIALVLFLATCFSTGVAVLVTRLGQRPAVAVTAGALCFALCIVLWPTRITVHKDPEAGRSADAGFYVYRPFWRGPYPRTQLHEIHIGNLEEYRNTGSEWFGETLIVTRADASDDPAYGWQDVPTLPNPGWSEADIDEVRGRSDYYACIDRHERSVGPFTRVDLVTPTFHADAFRRLCTPVAAK
ncbi:hypothetical protein [Luteimonas abyssi]|uniref:hypothetical protein n=1 Tax=Luteimonas abyssi TaxID=1247514 RepID=UPI000737C7DA|nr:hypothetical protein [Luteimonas abyssi]